MDWKKEVWGKEVLQIVGKGQVEREGVRYAVRKKEGHEETWKGK